jgi:hypothetical protein
MSTPERKILFWLILAIVPGVMVWRVLTSGPVIRDAPFTREYARIHDICSKLRFYVEEHPTAAIGDFHKTSANDLASAGILSPDDATYIREHHIVFRGFDPKRIAGDVPVLETIFTNTTMSRRIVGYSDGSTVFYDLQKSP